jgi:hypothetical protein
MQVTACFLVVPIIKPGLSISFVGMKHFRIIILSKPALPQVEYRFRQ